MRLHFQLFFFIPQDSVRACAKRLLPKTSLAAEYGSRLTSWGLDEWSVIGATCAVNFLLGHLDAGFRRGKAFPYWPRANLCLPLNFFLSKFHRDKKIVSIRAVGPLELSL